MRQTKFSGRSKLPSNSKLLKGDAPQKITRKTEKVGKLAVKSSSDYQTKIKKLEDELKLLTDYSSDTVYRLRYDTMRYEYISPAVRSLLGFAPEEMKKVNFRSLIVETKIVTDGFKVVDSFEELEGKRKGGDVGKWHADYLIRTKDGRKIWVSDISYPWFDDQGNIIGSVGSLRDITDRVVAEEKIKEELTKIANTDALTGASNRREFFEELDREMRRINRSETEVSILIIDIDNFKKVNDTYGHDVGDKVIVEVSKVIQTCLRETDLLARIGGEEFAVLLPDTSSKGAFWVGERIRTEVLKSEFKVGTDLKPVSCSVSIGVATGFPGDKRDSSDLYKIADTRLYIAKNTGRNQVSVDEIIHTH